MIASVNFVSSNAIASESALDRMACALGGKTMLPHILSNVPQMLQNSQYLLLFVLVCWIAWTFNTIYMVSYNIYNYNS